jgi:SynChlorMet cassette protein ScmC
MKDARGYSLRPADARGWHISATPDARPWLDRLASIMELRIHEPNGDPQLIFIRNLSCKAAYWEASRSELPQNGWSLHDFKALRVWLHSGVPHVICEIGPKRGHNLDLDIFRMLLSCYPIYHRAQDSGGLPFHAALIELERNGSGVLLAAQGNRGKSTCCRRIPPPWHALCDDETLVVRHDSRRYHAHPFPTWSDYFFRRAQRTWNVERHVPLSAIFFLEQADADTALPLGQGEAAVRIFRSAMQVWDGRCFHLDEEQKEALRRRCFENACEFAKAVPAFILRVSLFGRFWEEMENVLPWLLRQGLKDSEE